MNSQTTKFYYGKKLVYNVVKFSEYCSTNLISRLSRCLKVSTYFGTADSDDNRVNTTP